MPFKPGESGNPKGRPRVGESLAAAVRQRFPVDRIIDIAERLLDKEIDDRVRFNTLQFLAERGYGKVTQTVEGGLEISPGHLAFLSALQMTPEERRKRLAEVEAEDDEELARAEARAHDGEADP